LIEPCEVQAAPENAHPQTGAEMMAY